MILLEGHLHLPKSCSEEQQGTEGENTEWQ
jgi:hypothetical protein